MSNPDGPQGTRNEVGASSRRDYALPNIEALNNLESNLERLIDTISIRMDEEMSCSTPASIIPVPAAAAPTKSTHLKLSLPQIFWPNSRLAQVLGNV